MSAPAKIPTQFETDFWFSHCRQVVSAHDVALAFGMSIDQVADLEQRGIFIAAPINDAPLSARKRLHLRYERFSVVAWRMNELEDNGTPIPIKETPQITWWRRELRNRVNSLSSL